MVTSKLCCIDTSLLCCTDSSILCYLIDTSLNIGSFPAHLQAALRRPNDRQADDHYPNQQHGRHQQHDDEMCSTRRLKRDATRMCVAHREFESPVSRSSETSFSFPAPVLKSPAPPPCIPNPWPADCHTRAACAWKEGRGGVYRISLTRYLFRIDALDCGDPPQGGQLFRCKGLHHFPTSLELIDLGDKLQDFRRDRDVPDLGGVDSIYTHFHPIATQWQINIHLHPFI